MPLEGTKPLVLVFGRHHTMERDYTRFCPKVNCTVCLIQLPIIRRCATCEPRCISPQKGQNMFDVDFRKPRIVGNRVVERCLSPASVNRTVELLRHMLNWAVEREYLEKTPFRRGTETLIKKLREDNQRRRRLSPDEELRLLEAAPPYLRSMIVTALDTGTRRGEMLALRFADIDFAQGLIVLRGETTKRKKTRLAPISTQRLRAVLQWLRLDAEGKQKPDEVLVSSNEVGEALPNFHDAWLRTVLRAHGIKPRWAAGLKYKGLSRESKDDLPQNQPALARSAARVRHAPGRARRPAGAGP